MLIAAIDELATGDVIGDFLSLPELPGQGPLPCRHHLEGELVLVLDLGRVVLGQVLSHGVLLVISSNLLLVTVNPRMCRETRLSSIPHLTTIADSGVVSPGSEMTRARAGHPAVREQTPTSWK